jgi:hypothetical protein
MKGATWNTVIGKFILLFWFLFVFDECPMMGCLEGKIEKRRMGDYWDLKLPRVNGMLMVFVCE